MAKHVFILGAGTSVHTGAPLMNNFIDKAEDNFSPQDDSKDYEIAKKIFKLINELNEVYAKAYLDLNNIETVFGALEMARVFKKLKNYSLEQIDDLYKSMVFFIARTIEKTVEFPMIENYIAPTRTYDRFCEVLNKLNYECSVITFNYDIALDYSLHARGHNFSYMLEEDIQKKCIKLLKLHGSINWTKCLECNKILAYDFKSYFERYNYRGAQKYAMVPFLNRFNDLTISHKHQVDNLPMIVPPSWNKTDYQNNLSNVWHAAANELYEAKYIYILGYSLPEADSFFKYLYALGVLGETRLRGITIFNPDDSEDIKNRYNSIIGRGIENKFKFEKLIFDDACSYLSKNIKSAT